MNTLLKTIQSLALVAGFTITPALLAETTATVEDLATAEVNPAINTFGWYIAKQGMGQMKFTDAEKSEFLDGFKQGLNDTNPIDSRQDELRGMQEYFQQRMVDMREQASAEQEEQNTSFFADLAQNENIQKSDSGLYYEIIETGDDVRAENSDKVTLHYHGTLIDGTVFDSSKDRGQPATFPVSGVVPGFSEGVKLVGNGGKVKLYIPPTLGYGDNPGGRIPPNATLIFDVEMISIESATAVSTPPISAPGIETPDSE